MGMPQNSRRDFLCAALTAAGAQGLPGQTGRGNPAAFAFAHPGLLHTRQDLARMRDGVAANRQPIRAGFEVLRNHAQSKAEYRILGPLAEIGRNPTIHQREFDLDCNAAYQCALMWAITGDSAFAGKAKAILDAWSSTLKSIGGADAVLAAGLSPFKLINAAEILRHTDAGWSAEAAARAGRMFREVVYPVLQDFAPFANGNWDTAAIKTLLALGVYCGDRAIFERALRYYVDGAGDGRLTHYIYENGQCQESGRDQGHTQLGLAHLGDACEIAWHQGLDLYAWAGNRLLNGFEYTAQYNLGEEVPFTPDLDRTGKYRHAAISARGPLRPVYEQIYNHYANRAGIAAPCTQRAAEKLRPEGPAPGADHPGFGTLLYSLPAAARSSPAAPAAVIARGVPATIALTWIPVRGAAGYTVKRDGRVLAKNVQVASFTDTKVNSGQLYRYSVAAGDGLDSFPANACAGLPARWAHQDIGGPEVNGSAMYDGTGFTLEAAGSGISSAADQFHFAFLPIEGDSTFTVRFVPQVASQFAQFGIMMRQTPAPDSPHASLLLMPDAARPTERPAWAARLVSRGAESAAAKQIPAPYVTYGRLVKPYWLRLTRDGAAVHASVSTDGQGWDQVGSVQLPMTSRVLAGLAVCSRVPGISTRATFDQVTFHG